MNDIKKITRSPMIMRGVLTLSLILSTPLIIGADDPNEAPPELDDRLSSISEEGGRAPPRFSNHGDSGGDGDEDGGPGGGGNGKKGGMLSSAMLGALAGMLAGKNSQQGSGAASLDQLQQRAQNVQSQLDAMEEAQQREELAAAPTATATATLTPTSTATAVATGTVTAVTTGTATAVATATAAVVVPPSSTSATQTPGGK